MWFGQTFEGMLQSVGNEDDKADQIERKQIRLMQRVFGEENAPKLQYASMKDMMVAQGVGPGGKMERK